MGQRIGGGHGRIAKWGLLGALLAPPLFAQTPPNPSPAPPSPAPAPAPPARATPDWTALYFYPPPPHRQAQPGTETLDLGPRAEAPLADEPPPRRRTLRRLPDDLATRRSPFGDVTLGAVNMEDRFDDFAIFGLQLGIFAGRMRIVARASMLDDADDAFDEDGSSYYSPSSVYSGKLPAGFRAEDSEDATMIFGGGVGFALVRSSGFAMSPGVAFLTSDVGDYGSMLGVMLPFDWVRETGFRFGIDLTIGRGFGGRVQGRCQDFSAFGPGTAQPCDTGELRAFDRDAGAVMLLNGSLGWGAE